MGPGDQLGTLQAGPPGRLALEQLGCGGDRVFWVLMGGCAGGECPPAPR